MKNAFILYAEYAKHIAYLTMEQRGVLFTAILAFETDADLPEMDGMTQVAFSFISDQLSRDKEKYERTCKARSEAGARGGRPKNEEKQTDDDAFEAEQAEANEKRADDTESKEKQTEASESKEKQTEASESKEKQVKASESKKSICFFDESKKKQTKAKKPDNDNDNDNENDNEDDNEDEEERVEIDRGYGGKEETLPPSSPHGANEGMKAFLSEFPNVVVDNKPPASLDLDYRALAEAFRGSSWLKKRPHDFSWVAKNATSIIRGQYKDHVSSTDEVYRSLAAQYEEEGHG